jgi:membrane protein implicated in regulation of membrane protease activity
MSELFYGWLAVAVLALIIEMFTATLYGLSFSLSAFLIAAYVAISGETELTLAQSLIFAVSGAIFCFVFPLWFNKTSGPEFKQGLDAAIGHAYPLKKVGDTFKITVDGVEYPVDDDCVTSDFAPKKKAKVVSHHAGVIKAVLK